MHTYAWDAEGRPVTVDSVGLTYDALGRMVEQNRSGTYSQIIYVSGGNKLAIMSGQSLMKAFVPLPGGATAVYAPAGLSYYRHPDWLGSSRLASTPARAVFYDGAYAPFGESYAETGTTDRSFTGQSQGTVTGLYDFLFREYSATQGRWISPDPAGRTAVSAVNPQSWNRYAYVGNTSLTAVDPLGLLRSDAVGSFNMGCSINGFIANCAMVMAFANAGGGGEFGFICRGNCQDFNNGNLRIGGDNVIYHYSSLDHALEPWSAEYLSFSLLAGAKTNPCAGKNPGRLQYDKPLKYANGVTQTAREHITEGHLTPGSGASQYMVADPLIPVPASFEQVQHYNAMTFWKPDSFSVQGSRVVLEKFFPPIWDPHYKVWRFMGRSAEDQPESTNRLVVDADCVTVWTSYPSPP